MVGAHDHVIIAADPVGDGDRGSRDRVEGRGVEGPGVRENAEFDIVGVAVDGIGREHHAIEPGDGCGGEVPHVVDAEAERGGVATLQAGGRRRCDARDLQVRERNIRRRHHEHIQNIIGRESAGRPRRSHQRVIGSRGREGDLCHRVAGAATGGLHQECARRVVERDDRQEGAFGRLARAQEDGGRRLERAEVEVIEIPRYERDTGQRAARGAATGRERHGIGGGEAVVRFDFHLHVATHDKNAESIFAQVSVIGAHLQRMRSRGRRGVHTEGKLSGRHSRHRGNAAPGGIEQLVRKPRRAGVSWRLTEHINPVADLKSEAPEIAVGVIEQITAATGIQQIWLSSPEGQRRGGRLRVVRLGLEGVAGNLGHREHPGVHGCQGVFVIVVQTGQRLQSIGTDREGGAVGGAQAGGDTGRIGRHGDERDQHIVRGVERSIGARGPQIIIGHVIHRRRRHVLRERQVESVEQAGDLGTLSRQRVRRDHRSLSVDQGHREAILGHEVAGSGARPDPDVIRAARGNRISDGRYPRCARGNDHTATIDDIEDPREPARRRLGGAEGHLCALSEDAECEPIPWITVVNDAGNRGGPGAGDLRPRQPVGLSGTVVGLALQIKTARRGGHHQAILAIIRMPLLDPHVVDARHRRHKLALPRAVVAVAGVRIAVKIRDLGAFRTVDAVQKSGAGGSVPGLRTHKNAIARLRTEAEGVVIAGATEVAPPAPKGAGPIRRHRLRAAAQKHSQRRAVISRCHQIDTPVAVEVTRRHRVHIPAAVHVGGVRRTENPRTLVFEHIDIIITAADHIELPIPVQVLQQQRIGVGVAIQTERSPFEQRAVRLLMPAPDLRAIILHRQQVRPVVAVHVPYRQRLHPVIRPPRIHTPRRIAPVQRAIIYLHRQVARRSHRQIHPLVPIEFPRRNRIGVAAHREVHLGGKGSVSDRTDPVTIQNAHGVRTIVRRGNIEPAVAVEIVQHQPGRLRAGGVIDPGRQHPAGPRIQKHPHRRAVQPRHHHIRLPVPVHITHRQHERLVWRRIRHRRSKRPVPIALQHTDRPRVIVCAHQVQLPVAVKVRRPHAVRRGATRRVFHPVPPPPAIPGRHPARSQARCGRKGVVGARLEHIGRHAGHAEAARVNRHERIAREIEQARFCLEPIEPRLRRAVAHAIACAQAAAVGRREHDAVEHVVPCAKEPIRARGAQVVIGDVIRRGGLQRLGEAQREVPEEIRHRAALGWQRVRRDRRWQRVGQGEGQAILRVEVRPAARPDPRIVGACGARGNGVPQRRLVRGRSSSEWHRPGTVHHLQNPVQSARCGFACIQRHLRAHVQEAQRKPVARIPVAEDASNRRRKNTRGLRPRQPVGLSGTVVGLALQIETARRGGHHQAILAKIRMPLLDPHVIDARHRRHKLALPRAVVAVAGVRIAVKIRDLGAFRTVDAVQKSGAGGSVPGLRTHKNAIARLRTEAEGVVIAGATEVAPPAPKGAGPIRRHRLRAAAQKHSQRRAVISRCHQIDTPVAVEVTRRHRVHIPAAVHVGGVRRTENPRTLVFEHIDIIITAADHIELPIPVQVLQQQRIGVGVAIQTERSPFEQRAVRLLMPAPDLRAIILHRQQVRPVVAVHVPYRQRLHPVIRPPRIHTPRRIAPVQRAIIYLHRQVARRSHRQIHPLVPIEFPRRNRIGVAAHREVHLGGKGSVSDRTDPVTIQNAHGVRTIVRRGNIEPAVAVEIVQHQPGRLRAGRVIDPGRKHPAGPCIQEHPHRRAIQPRHHHIRLPIAVHIAHRQHERLVRRRVRHRRPKRPIPVALQYTDRPRVIVRAHQVQLPVTVKVRRPHAIRRGPTRRVFHPVPPPSAIPGTRHPCGRQTRRRRKGVVALIFDAEPAELLRREFAGERTAQGIARPVAHAKSDGQPGRPSLQRSVDNGESKDGAVDVVRTAQGIDDIVGGPQQSVEPRGAKLDIGEGVRGNGIQLIIEGDGEALEVIRRTPPGGRETRGDDIEADSVAEAAREEIATGQSPVGRR